MEYMRFPSMHQARTTGSSTVGGNVFGVGALCMSVNTSAYAPRQRAAGTRYDDRARILIERFSSTFENQPKHC